MASPAHRSPALTLFHPATSSARSTGPHLTPASASYHFRDVAARICLEKGFAGIQAGALEQLEWEAERYVSGLMHDALALAQDVIGRRRPMLVDALEAIVQERQYDERDECIGRWRKAIGGDLRRRRNGNGMGPSPSNIPSRIPPSPPAKRTISLSDDEFDVPHLNIPFRPPTAIDFKPKLPVPGTASSVNAGPSTAVPQTPTAGPAGFKLKLKMGATSAGKPGLFSPPAMPGGSGPSEVDAPLIQSQLAGMPKRKAEETRPPPRKKSKEQRAEERAYLEESRLRVPDWGLPSGLLPALPPRHAVASGRAALERAAGTSGKEGDGAADAAGTTGSDGLTAAPPADDPASTDEKPTTAPASTDIPLRPPKLDAPALAFLQATLRERLDLQPEVGIVHYRRADRAPAVRPYRALVEGLLGGPAGKGAARAGKRWKVRGLPVGK